MKKLLIVCLSIMISQLSFAQFDLMKAAEKVVKKTSGGGADDNVAGGLKEALRNGIDEGVKKLSATDGYLGSALYKVTIPEDMRKVVAKVSMLPGFGNVETEIITKMNRAAESAAPKAGSIFGNAIVNMSITDATSILMGNKDAATVYLKKSTFDQLYKEFNPFIDQSLSEVGATKYWGDVVNAYNRIPFVTKANPDLKDYVTRKSLDGLFGTIAEKELLLRDNPALRSTELLKKVFSKQDKK
jgi:hypothetical protein